MHNSVVKPYDEFYFFKKYFPMFLSAQKYKINYLSSIFKEAKFRVLQSGEAVEEASGRGGLKP